MKNDGKTADALHIQPLNDDLLANLSIEELEGRLEMQILHLTEAQFCYDCTSDCASRCAPEGCSINCPADCGDCLTFCSADCSADCATFQPPP